MLGPTLAMVAVLLVPTELARKAKHVHIASVESRVESSKLATSNPKAVLRDDLEKALDAIDWKREGVRAPFEVVAVLAAAESSAGREGAQASCTVSVLLREKSGALLGSVSGTARGKERGAKRSSLELGVLEAAVQSASAAIPQAVRKSRDAR
jgi:hypothetical protein